MKNCRKYSLFCADLRNVFKTVLYIFLPSCSSVISFFCPENKTSLTIVGSASGFKRVNNANPYLETWQTMADLSSVYHLKFPLVCDGI